MVKQFPYKIVWDTNALEEFKDILIYLEKQSVQAPKIVKKAIIERITFLQTSPLVFELDKLKESPNGEFRAFVVFSYRITYQVKANEMEVRIIRVRHTSREPLGY